MKGECGGFHLTTADRNTLLLISFVSSSSVFHHLSMTEGTEVKGVLCHPGHDYTKRCFSLATGLD